MTSPFQVKDRVYRMTEILAEPMIIVGIKRRRFNRDKYLVSKAAKERYIEIVSAKELVEAPLLNEKATASTKPKSTRAIGGLTVEQAARNARARAIATGVKL